MNPSHHASRIPVVFPEGNRDVTALASRAMSVARSAQPRWAREGLRRRLGLLRKLRYLIAEDSLSIAEASALARLRPVSESLSAEVLPLAEACRFLERNAKRVLAPRRLGRRPWPPWLADVNSEVLREPFGVILIIGPGNYPLYLPGVQLLQALVAGNAVLLKPGIGGTTAARAMLGLLSRAGFPMELVSLLPESTEAARAAMLAGPDKVLFTGSAATGEKILTQLATPLIPATMELSGCDAVIVCADADLDLTTKALGFGLRLNNGATCMSPKRVFVVRSIATELEGRIAQIFNSRNNRHEEVRSSSKNIQIYLAPGVAERLRRLLKETLALGAHFVVGEMRADGTVCPPIVLAGVPAHARLLREDIFVPMLAIVTVADDDEALLQTNDCPFGLAASIFSRDQKEARSLAARIDAGAVTINDIIVPTADARIPFGGQKRSGFGVTRGAEGLLELTRPKVITITHSRFRPAFDEPKSGDEKLFQAFLKVTHGHHVKCRLSALIALMRILSTRRKSLPQEKL